MNGGDERSHHFERQYRESAEPWRYSERAAERLRHAWVGRAAGALPGAAVLDLGCSAGQLTERLRAPSRTVFAVDLSPSAVARTMRRIAAPASAGARGSGPVIGVSASALQLPFASGSLDGVVASDGLHSWRFSREERVQALREIRRVLAPGGWALLTEHLRPEQFEGFVAQVGDAPLRVERVEYLYDRAWYRFESWFKAVRHVAPVRALLRWEALARGLSRVSRPLGARGSRHICVLARAG